MLALEISSLKQFMARLLATDAFDDFLLEEAVIKTGYDITIDGHVNAEFFGGDEVGVELPTDEAGQAYELMPWKTLRSICFDLIKGKRTPLAFQFVLHVKPEKTAALLAENGCDVDPACVRAFVLNIRFDGTKAKLTSAASYATFLLTKEPDAIWDKALMQFLDAQQIAYERM